MDNILALEAVSRTFRKLADNTLRFSIDFEPQHMVDAIKLFGQEGTPIFVVPQDKDSSAERGYKEFVRQSKDIIDQPAPKKNYL